MARNPFWLRGAKGKFAGSVVYKGENGTVVRENVDPSNPQTTAQMCQRVAWATVSRAAKYMLPVIGQSFEGKSSEKENRREFFKQNVARLSKSYKNILEGSVNRNSTQYRMATPKGIKTLIPNNYVISDGSLPEGRIKVLYTGHASALTNAPLLFSTGSTNASEDIVFGEFTETSDTVTVSGSTILQLLLGIKAGQQLTVAAINTNPNTKIWENEMGDDIVRSGSFYGARICAKTADAMPSFVLGVNSTGNGISINGEVIDVSEFSIQDFVQDLLDMSKTSQDFYDFIAPVFEGSDLRVTAEQKFILRRKNNDASIQNLIDQVTPGWKNQAAAIFVSQLVNGEWQYSKSQMFALISPEAVPAESNPMYYGATIGNALPTYVKTSDENSTKFTQRGGSISSVGE